MHIHKHLYKIIKKTKKLKSKRVEVLIFNWDAKMGGANVDLHIYN